MASDREAFSLSGPLHLTAVDWTNAHHRRSVTACLVQGVYVMELDRQKERKRSKALGPPWWGSFGFKMRRTLTEGADKPDIFGAVYEFEPPPTSNNNLPTDGIPRYVIAFRGTLIKLGSFKRDMKSNFRIYLNDLHRTSRFEIAIQVRNTVAFVGSSNVWLAGHSLGSAMAMLVGKAMAKTGVFLQSFLFNAPFVSAPIEKIEDEDVKHGIRIAGSVITAGLALAMKKTNHNNRSADPFLALCAWVPCLFVNPADDFCSEYIGYFKHRKLMEEIGAGCIGRLATQHSLRGLLVNAIGIESEPIHVIPSANLTVNLTPSPDSKEAHGLRQWWRPDLHLESTLYSYK